MKDLLHIRLYKYNSKEEIFQIQRVFLDEENDPRILHYIVDGMLKELNYAVKKSECEMKLLDKLAKMANDAKEQLKKENAEQAKEIEQLNFVLKNLVLATNKKINELEEEIEHLKNKVQYWKGLHK
jgi:polyhydroxyalkanoate synthesis regulator phasin